MFDAVVVGAGHNGLAAAVVLARAGWKVLVLEAQSEPGGAVQTSEAVLPQFRHDLYATNLNAFAGSAFAAEFGSELAACGLAFVRADKPFCSVFPDGDCVGVSRSLDETLDDAGRQSPRDAAAWQSLTRRFRRIAPDIFGILQRPMPSAYALRRGLGHAALIAQSSGGFVRRWFSSPKMQALWAVWGMHLDFPPGVPGGALYPYLQCMTMQANGMSLGRGGAGTMIDALAALLRACGGEIRCRSPVTRIVIERDHASAVVSGGETIRARRAVIANLAPAVLYRLLGKPLVKRYRHGPGSMMIHLAMSDLPPWRNGRAREFAYVHVGPSLQGMTAAYGAAMRGERPDEPVLIVAQPGTVDPARAPPGRQVCSIQVRVVPSADDWDRVKEAYADHIMALLERYAPGVGERVLGRRVLSPLDLERANANLIGGDNIGGSHHLGQHFLFRPFFGWWHYRTPFKRLYMCGASTWPGGGVGAGSGYLLGRQLTKAQHLKGIA